MHWASENPRWAPLLPAYAAAAVLFWSFAHPQTWTGPGGQCVALAEGSLRVNWRDSAPVPVLTGIPIVGRFFGSAPAPVPNWWFAFEFKGPSPCVAIPLWAPVLCLGLAGAAMRRRRESNRHCPGCGYDLAGLPGNPDSAVCCPECGVQTIADAAPR